VVDYNEMFAKYDTQIEGHKTIVWRTEVENAVGDGNTDETEGLGRLEQIWDPS
jgi:hypothetical protein